MKLLSQNYVKYGLLMTGVVALCLLIMEVTGQNKSFEKAPLFAAVTMLAPFVVWYLGLNSKKKMLKGKMNFKQGVAEGFLISLVYGLVSPFVFLFYYLFVNPQILPYVKEAYHMNGASDAMVITVDMTIQLVAAVIFGTLYGAILSLFLKTKKKK